MLLNHDNIEVYAWCEPTDMRKGFEGLSALVRNEMKMNELSGEGGEGRERGRRRAKDIKQLNRERGVDDERRRGLYGKHGSKRVLAL